MVAAVRPTRPARDAEPLHRVQAGLATRTRGPWCPGAAPARTPGRGRWSGAPAPPASTAPARPTAGSSTVISLTVSDAADLCKRYDPESRPTWPRSIRFAGSWCLPICWGGPDGGLMPSTAAKPTAPPSSSGLGHRPFKAAARVRIPLGARPDQEAARALAAMRWRVSRARRPGRAAGAPGRGPPGSAAPWTSSSGQRRRDRPRPARSAAGGRRGQPAPHDAARIPGSSEVRAVRDGGSVH